MNVLQVTEVKDSSQLSEATWRPTCSRANSQSRTCCSLANYFAYVSTTISIFIFLFIFIFNYFYFYLYLFFFFNFLYFYCFLFLFFLFLLCCWSVTLGWATLVRTVGWFARRPGETE